MKARRTLSECLEEGRALFNSGRYFEAHEAWEEAWLVESGETKRWLQGLIQVAAGLLKARSGSPSAAVRLLEAGLAKIESAPASPPLGGFAAEVRGLTGTLRETGAPPVPGPVLPAFGSVK